MKKAYMKLHETWQAQNPHRGYNPMRKREQSAVRLVLVDEDDVYGYVEFRWHTWNGATECRLEVNHTSWLLLEELPEITRWMRRFYKEQDCAPTVENLLTWLKMQGFEDGTPYAPCTFSVDVT
jgi:sulfur relay (sulfurtransferase) DsrC/TusE family protein